MGEGGSCVGDASVCDQDFEFVKLQFSMGFCHVFIAGWQSRWMLKRNCKYTILAVLLLRASYSHSRMERCRMVIR